jgi:hypothetical protein
MIERLPVDLSNMAYSDQAPGFGEKVPNNRGTSSCFSVSAAVKKEGIKKRHTKITVAKYLPIAHLRFIRFTINFIHCQQQHFQESYLFLTPLQTRVNSKDIPSRSLYSHGAASILLL